MKIKPIKQVDDTACGPTSILMVARYFKKPITFKEIASVSLYTERQGLSDDELVESLVNLSFSVKTSLNTTWSKLLKSNTDKNVIIISWMIDGYIGHFSVVDSVTENEIILADPKNGKFKKFEKIHFMRLWMSYDDMWYPAKNTDITLRWMCVVKKKKA